MKSIANCLNVGTSFGFCGPSRRRRSMCALSAASAANFVFTDGVPSIRGRVPSGRRMRFRYLQPPLLRSRYAGMLLLLCAAPTCTSRSVAFERSAGLRLVSWTDAERAEERALRDPDHASRSEAGGRDVARVDQLAQLLHADAQRVRCFTRGEHRREMLEVGGFAIRRRLYGWGVHGVSCVCG